jgi:hypothetical protein
MSDMVEMLQGRAGCGVCAYLPGVFSLVEKSWRAQPAQGQV